MVFTHPNAWMTCATFAFRPLNKAIKATDSTRNRQKANSSRSRWAHRSHPLPSSSPNLSFIFNKMSTKSSASTHSSKDDEVRIAIDSFLTPKVEYFMRICIKRSAILSYSWASMTLPRLLCLFNNRFFYRTKAEMAYCVAISPSESGNYWFKRLHYTYTLYLLW